jgi:hypothetical protein
VQENNLGSRREFLKKAVTGAGVAFAAPAILSMVRPTDLAAQVSGGMSVDQGSASSGGGPPPWAGGGPPPRGRGRR